VHNEVLEMVTASQAARGGAATGMAAQGACAMAIHVRRRQVLIAAAGTCSLLPGRAVVAQVVPDLPWSQLSPPGWRAQPLLDRLGVADLVDDDPRSKAVLAKVHREWQKAPPVRRVPKGKVRMTGFAEMLDDGQAAVRQVLLVPYSSFCIHSPPPPANQLVLVSLASELPRHMNGFPVRIIAELQIKTGSTRNGKVLYRMDDAQWEPFPWPRHPLPVYRLP